MLYTLFFLFFLTRMGRSVYQKVCLSTLARETVKTIIYPAGGSTHYIFKTLYGYKIFLNFKIKIFYFSVRLEKVYFWETA